MIFHTGPEGTANYGGSFVEETLVVDGRTWINCVFYRCVLTREDPDTQLWRAIYDHCTFIGKGWPEWFPK
jgi:hypothetical protein